MSLRLLAEQLRDAAAAFDPGVWSGADCAALVEVLASAEKACAVARGRAAVRAAECGAQHDRGFTDASEWVARHAGSSIKDARDMLETVAAVEHCPETRDALVAGELSLVQAREIVRTESAVAGSEGDLLKVARTSGLGALRDAGRKRRVGAMDREALRREQWRRREVAHWRDDIGMVCGRFALPPEVGVAFVNRLDRETDRVQRAERRKKNGVESREAYAANAFLTMVEAPVEPQKPDGGSGGKRRPRSRAIELVLVCELAAFRRGYSVGDELSHIVGGGPVPVSTIRELADGAFLKIVLHDGVKIDTVAHLGRHRPAELRTALELGPLPDLDGVTCVEDGCDRRYRLEWDHVDPVAHGGLTTFDNVKPKCPPHHWVKTEADRRAGLLGSRKPKRAPP